MAPNKNTRESVHTLDPFRLLVQDVDHTDVDTIIARLGHLPIGKALQGGGMFTVGAQPLPIEIPILPKAKDELRLQKVRIGTAKEHTFGAVVALDGLLTKAHSLYDAAQLGRKRFRKPFYEDYERELWDQTAHVVDGELLQTQWEPGYQAQADTDVRLGWDEVGISPWVERRLLRIVQETYGVELATLDGVEVLFQRFPAMSGKPARWVTLRVLKGRTSSKIYVHGGAFQLLHGGDTDGDLCYFSIWRSLRFKRDLQSLPFWPRFELLKDRAPLRLSQCLDAQGMKKPLCATLDPAAELEARRKAMTEQVMGACVKYLTGLLTHVVHVLARSAGYALRRKTGAQDAYRRCFTIGFPLIEAVMDARKPGGAGQHAVLDLATALERMMQNKDWDAEMQGAFAPFLTEELLADLETLYRAGDNMRFATRGAGGKLVAAGNRGLQYACQQVVDELVKQGHDRRQVMDVLRADLLMQKVVRMPDPKPRQPKGQVPVSRYHVPQAFTCFQDVLLALQCRNSRLEPKPVFTEVNRKERESRNPYPAMTVQATPYWMCASPNPPKYPAIQLRFPAVDRLNAFGHCRVQMPGGRVFFFRPVVRLCEDGTVRRYDLFNELLVQLRLLMDQFLEKKIWSSHEKLELHFNKCIRDFVEGLDRSSDTGNWMGQCEVAIACTPASQDLRTFWTEIEEILTHLVGEGYDVSAGSKGEPGTLAARGNPHNDARYGEFLNPCYRFGNWGRRPELRGVREALALQHPTCPTLHTPGRELPEAFRDRVRMAWFAFADTNYDHFDDNAGSAHGVCFDTILATRSFMELMAVKEEVFEVSDEHLQDFLKAKREIGIEIGEEDIKPIYEFLGQLDGPKGMQDVCLVKHRITVRGERVVDGETKARRPDEGKIKCLWGPMKGVMTLLPDHVRPYILDPETGETIWLDGFWPSYSAAKKQFGDCALSSQREKAGLPEVRPDATLPELVAETRAALEAKGWDAEGVETVYIDTKDGDRLAIGKAFVGPIPVYRATETEAASARFMHQGQGMKLEVHSMILAQDEEHEMNYPSRPEAERRFDLLQFAIAATREQLKKAPSQIQGAAQGEAGVKAPASSVSDHAPAFTDADCPVAG